MSEPRRYESVPIQGDGKPMSTSACAAESFNLLNAGARKHWRGQGDTWTAARDRAAAEAGITPSQAERLQKNWRTMKFPNGDVYRLLLKKYGHLCTRIENAADAMDRERQEIEATHANGQSALPVVARTEGAEGSAEKARMK